MRVELGGGYYPSLLLMPLIPLAHTPSSVVSIGPLPVIMDVHVVLVNPTNCFAICQL